MHTEIEELRNVISENYGSLVSRTVSIKATSVIDKDIYSEIIINISQYVAPSVDEIDLERAQDLLSKMTIEQKVGQMFVVIYYINEVMVMKKIYKLLIIVVTFIVCLLLTSCKKNYTVTIKGDRNVLEGEQIALSIETNKESFSVEWSSSNPEVASVNNYLSKDIIKEVDEIEKFMAK